MNGVPLVTVYCSSCRTKMEVLPSLSVWFYLRLGFYFLNQTAVPCLGEAASFGRCPYTGRVIMPAAPGHSCALRPSELWPLVVLSWA